MGGLTLTANLGNRACSRADVQELFEELRAHAEDTYYGDPEDIGYSGDWNTVYDLKFSNTVFDSAEQFEAHFNNLDHHKHNALAAQVVVDTQRVWMICGGAAS